MASECRAAVLRLLISPQPTKILGVEAVWKGICSRIDEVVACRGRHDNRAASRCAGLPLAPAPSASRPAYGSILCWTSRRHCAPQGVKFYKSRAAPVTAPGGVRSADHAGDRPS